MAFTGRRLRIQRPFEQREREALQETVFFLEKQVHDLKIELTKTRRELTAARLLLSIARSLGDRRGISAAREREMLDTSLTLIESEAVLVPPYLEALENWEKLNDH